jgi:hypothetical protein
MISDENHLLCIRSQCRDNMTLQNLSGFLYKQDIRARSLNTFLVLCRSSCRASNNPLITQSLYVPLLKLSPKLYLAPIVVLGASTEFLHMVLEDVVLPHRNFGIAGGWRHPPDLGRAKHMRMLFEYTSVVTLGPLIQKIVLIHRASPLPDPSHPIFIRWNAEGLEEFVVFKFDVVHDLRIVSRRCHKLLERELKTLGMDFSFSFAAVNDLPISLAEVRNARLVSECQWLGPWTGFPTQTNEALLWDTYTQKVFEELVQRVICITYNKDSILAIIMEEPCKQGADKRFAST